LKNSDRSFLTSFSEPLSAATRVSYNVAKGGTFAEADDSGFMGDAAAAKNRDFAASQMTPAQIAEAQRLAKEWLEKHPQ
jgi:hypothetical protein